MFAVDSLPLKYRVEIYRRYPDAQEKADSKPFMDRIEPDGKALMYFEEYILSDGRHLPTDKQMEYANRRMIPYVVIIGSNELQERKATIKNMISGEQSSVAFDDVCNALK